MAMEKIIIVNSGSVSKKYALYQGVNLILSAHFEILPNELQIHIKNGENISRSQKINKENFDKAFDYFIDLLIEGKIINSEKEIKAVSFRVVAPGKFFQKDLEIDKNFLEKLDEISDISLIHIKTMRVEMNQVIDRLPQTRYFAISDSAFHSTIPEYAGRYAIANNITEELELYRYGYHGISVSSIIEALKQEDKLFPKTIVCHLGGGSSITAVLNGQSVENSMGYTPLEGLPMSTRSGSVDPGAILSIMDYQDYETEEMKNFLFYHSGLLAVSEISSDIRELIKYTEEGNLKTALALNMFTYSIKKHIGSYMAVLGGLDLLVFTGTIGERSDIIRNKICAGLDKIGIELDNDLNQKIDGNGYINKPKSPVAILVKKTDEMLEMARKTSLLLS
jgi:acetate kinase